MEVLDCFELTNRHLLRITTDNTSSSYLMTHKLRWMLQVSGIECLPCRNLIPCMAHVIQLAVGAFMSSLGVKGRSKSWEAHERDQQFGENESIDIGKSQRLRKEGNARFNMVCAMRPGLAKIIEKVRISRYFENHENDSHIAANACCNDHTDTWSWKRVHWRSKSKCANHSTTCHVCEDTVEFDIAVAWASLLSSRLHLWEAQESKLQSSPASLHNTGWKDHHSVCHARSEAIPVLDPVDVETAYSFTASR